MLSIHDISSWPPGTLIAYKHPRFKSIGLVVSNDGMDCIHVVWEEVCKQQYCVYDVSRLNPTVIKHVE